MSGWMGLTSQQVGTSNCLMYYFLRSEVQEDGCIVWTGFKDRKGYGKLNVSINGEQLAHRSIYKAFYGSIPSDLTVDHLCKNKACINIQHMEIVTSAENTRRREANQNTGKQFCTHGHEFTEENTYINPKRGTRDCKACSKIRSQKYAYRRLH